MRLLIVVLCLTALPGAAVASDCTVPAFSVDEDPKGLNIRKGPGSNHPVIGVVPRELRDAENRAALYAKSDSASKEVGRVPGATEIEILACTGRWVKATYEGRTGWLRPEEICGDPVGYCQ